MNIYYDEIIDRYRHPNYFGSINKPTVFHQEFNSACGDIIRMELKIKSDKLIDVAFSGEGCAISIASASYLCEMIAGNKLKDVKKVTKEILLEKLKFPLSPTRLKCAWLSFEVLQKAIAKL